MNSVRQHGMNSVLRQAESFVADVERFEWSYRQKMRPMLRRKHRPRIEIGCLATIAVGAAAVARGVVVLDRRRRLWGELRHRLGAVGHLLIRVADQGLFER